MVNQDLTDQNPANSVQPAAQLTAQFAIPEQVELYERLQTFSLDQPDAQLSFSQRLARDNGWSLQYAQQAIAEYKKFAFLAVAAGHPVTPSDQVDQVWHLHLTYTRSYWDEFCSQVLQTPLHHEPTQGGQAEGEKFTAWYSKTLESYERFFGPPPVEFWPAPTERFGRDLNFIRLNTQQNWILPKSGVLQGIAASVAVILALSLSGCYVSSSASSLGPVTGALVAVICAAVGLGIVQMLVDIVNAIKNPQTPQMPRRSRRGWSSDGGGCGGGDWSGWGFIDAGGHHGDGSGSNGDCGDGGGGDGGCGGGGCGGGGCGGCGG